MQATIKALRHQSANTVIDAVKALEPPLSPEIERELIAIAYAHGDAGPRKAAMKLVKAHVADAADLKKALKAALGTQSEGTVCERLRALNRPDRGLLASAMIARGAAGYGVAFDEAPAFARALLPKLVDKKKRRLDLTHWHKSSSSVWSIRLRTIPDVVFDDLKALRKKAPFDELFLWGGVLEDLPDRFVEFAPFLKRLTLAYQEFERIPDVVFECKHLEELIIRERRLVELNPRITKLKKLKRLTLSESKKIKKLPLEVCALTGLEHLGLGQSNITALPPEIGQLKKLKSIHLQSSKVRKLPAELGDLPALKKLNIRWSGVKLEDAKALLTGVKIER
jgi:hypothetical protein